MEISRKTDYALRMLAELVRNDGTIVSVRSAAEHNKVPYSFARSIQHDLAQAGIVDSVRGAHGGMKLSVDPKKATLLELVEAIQGPIFLASCDYAGEDGGPCPFKSECHFNPVWCNADYILRKYFSSVTLYEVVVDHKLPRMVGSFEKVLPKDADYQQEAND